MTELDIAKLEKLERAAIARAMIPNDDRDDEINEACYDAVCDGEGRLTAYYLRHHLAKRGLVIVAAAEMDSLRTLLAIPKESTP